MKGIIRGRARGAGGGRKRREGDLEKEEIEEEK
jgi:hypothetical protein